MSRYIPSYIAWCNFWSLHLIQALPKESSVMHSDRRKHVHATPRAISSKSFWLAKSLLSMQIHSTWFGHLRQNRSRAHVDLIATTNIFKQGFPPETLITLTNKMKNQSVSIRRNSNMECVLGYKVNKFTQFHPHLILALAHYHTFLSKARPIQTALFWQDPPLHEMAARSPFKRTLIVWLPGMFHSSAHEATKV